MANASIITVKVFIFISFTFYGLAFPLAHFLGIRHFSMLPYIADTSRAVGVKEQCEHFAYKIGIDFTLPYVTLTFGTGMITFAYAAFLQVFLNFMQSSTSENAAEEEEAESLD